LPHSFAAPESGSDACQGRGIKKNYKFYYRTTGFVITLKMAQICGFGISIAETWRLFH
jgi:hypothetical protein